MLYLALGGQAVLTVCAYWWETRSPPDESRSKLRTAGIWSAAWLLIGLLPTALFGLFSDSRAASAYAAVYLIERALSLDNVFVFLVLIAAFEIPSREHARLVSSGSLFAFALRAPQSWRAWRSSTPCMQSAMRWECSCSHSRGKRHARAKRRPTGPAG